MAVGFAWPQIVANFKCGNLKNISTTILVNEQINTTPTITEADRHVARNFF